MTGAACHRARLRAALVGLAALLGVLSLGLIGPAGAIAQPRSKSSSKPAAPTVSTPSATTVSKPAAKPASKPVVAVTGSPALRLGGLFTVDHQLVTVPGRAVTVTGEVRPWVAGQRVHFQAFDDGHLFRSYELRLKLSPNRTYGRFTVTVHSPTAGSVRIVMTHSRNPELHGFVLARRFSALSENVTFNSYGHFVQLMQQRLSALHFYIPLTGIYDNGMGLAVDAYHRLLGHGTAQTLDPGTVNDLLDGVGTFHVRFPGQGSHAEGDLSDQLLALIHGSSVYWIFPISSGKPSTPTVLGSWRVYRRTPGYLPDGMYYSSFFTGGYAIHGYNPAPDYPASHGCMRLPIVDAIAAYNWLNYGDWVDTYYT